MSRINHYSELHVYRAAFELQQTIFEASKSFPKEERYALTDQVRRSARSVGANLAEAWQKRRYRAHFVSKLTDADAELSETEHWIRTAHACGYLNREDALAWHERVRTVGRMIGGMLNAPERWCD